MQPAQLEILKSYGMDAEATIARFCGNEPLMLRFLTGFPSDKTMQSLRNAAASADREGMMVAAHSLKGLAGNLGLTPLYEASSSLMSALRQSQENITVLYEKVCEEYDNALAMLSILG
jgi:HPt (histidine-containing phosphotransfer) domain-containing protein